jgi:hypothetical protein
VALDLMTGLSSTSATKSKPMRRSMKRDTCNIITQARPVHIDTKFPRREVTVYERICRRSELGCLM